MSEATSEVESENAEQQRIIQNLGEQLGIRLVLKREDLTHTGSHKINNVLGQALLAKRMGKKRLVATIKRSTTPNYQG